MDTGKHCAVLVKPTGNVSCTVHLSYTHTHTHTRVYVVYKMGYYSAMRKEESLTFLTIWINPEDIIQSVYKVKE